MLSIENQNYTCSVILPLYKPRGNWINLFLQNVKEIDTYLPANISINYVVVYDGPPDNGIIKGFHKILSAIKNISFLSYSQNMGKGFAMRKGVEGVDTDFILVTDFDFPYKKTHISELIELLKDGNEVVVGKRSKSYFENLPLKRKIISKLCILLKKTFLNLPMYDTQSGIKAFNAAGKQVFLQTTINRFLADTEFILRSHKKQLAIKEIDLELEPYVQFSNFGLKVIKTELGNFLKLLYLNKKLKKTVRDQQDNLRSAQYNCEMITAA
jgi:hypothetical protein